MHQSLTTQIAVVRMPGLVERAEATLWRIEGRRAGQEATGAVSSAARRLVKLLYCVRDLHRLGTGRMFATENNQDKFFQVNSSCILQDNMLPAGFLRYPDIYRKI